jgi:NAD(P)-dependent dehydrogenase (short-subunit alcohol dehydrogenase family)
MVVGIDRCVVDTTTALSCTHMLHMDICDLAVAERTVDEPLAKRSATPTPAGRLKSLLASLAAPGHAPGCDLLVCNAAVQRLGLLSTLSLADWNDTLATNLTAPAMLTQVCAHTCPAYRVRAWGGADPSPQSAAPPRAASVPGICSHGVLHPCQPHQARLRCVRSSSVATRALSAH